MKISIITVSYNSEQTIEQTIKSVLGQKGADLEYIIVDGGSKDGTLEIINRYKDKITKIISEPDKGIYDAMNKGVQLATGDVVGIINSDDFYFDDNVLNSVVIEFEKSDVDAVYGDIVYVDREETKKHVRFWKAGEYKESKLKSGWIMPHPAFFVRRECYEKWGIFNLSFKIAADYELMLRFIKKGLRMKYLSQILVCMREGGYSASNFKQRVAGWQELKKSWQINGLKVPKFFVIRRVLSKVNQYLKKNK